MTPPDATITPPVLTTNIARLHDCLIAYAQFFHRNVLHIDALLTPPDAFSSALGKGPSVRTPLFGPFFSVKSSAADRGAHCLIDTQADTEIH